ncbi:MAG TPA: peptidyl-prolyl cis-trans isomerase [Anaeromyxobacteraceae bacterium]|nr:peptidyl-prolyl cis-trans isomerase [Anaeromyxobacteraceae bacterium]
MTRGLAATGIAIAVLAAACKPTPPGMQKGSGPAVAQGDGITVTADEFKARLEEQSPFVRQRYSTLDRKKEFLENLVRVELLSKEAEKEGLANDPDVQNTLRKAMVQKLVQRKFSEGDPTKDVSDAEAQKFYDEHKDEFQKPARLRLTGDFIAATDKNRAAKSSQAKKAYNQLKAGEKKNPAGAQVALQTLAKDSSDDAASKAAGGDLGFKTKDEYAKQFGAPFADAAFKLKPDDTVILETPQGFWIVRVTGRQDEINRPFEQMKVQIQNRLFREKRTKEFDEFVKKLRDDAHVTVNDAELEKVSISTGGGPMMGHGMPGMGGMGGGMPPHGAMPPAPPAQSAAPASAPVSAPAQK